ncbi:MAG: aminotransferase class V-fold PLP-dependent enzyme [Acidobacteriota bacterium]|nr:aminotransferase class V-fold PLP-dependent enzyme [Acidobacteriota bacterium]
MKRRTFLASGLVGSLTAGSWSNAALAGAPIADMDIRAAFPRMEQEIYLNAAGLMPLATFGQEALQKYMTYQQMGPKAGTSDYVFDMWDDIRGLFAKMVGAEESEIGLVHCTKAGEQIAIDAVDHIKKGGNIVTNDLHFSGSLHNLTGLQKAGRDVRFVRAKNWRVSVEDMKKAVDDRTALVTLTLLSNINGQIADVKAIAEHAHRHGALVYADIIQAAGVVPLDLHALDVDVAACSCYKWLYGVYGTGFLYVRKELQGKRLPDMLYPGRVHYNYEPWTGEIDANEGMFGTKPQKDATRYQPGHVNYMGYCAVYEGLKFLHKVGVENALAHSVKLNRRLLEKIDPKKYPCITPDVTRSPIITFLTENPQELRKKLKAADVVITVAHNRMRVSPALYNNEADIDALAVVLNG